MQIAGRRVLATDGQYSSSRRTRSRLRNFEPPIIEVTIDEMMIIKEGLWSGSRKGVNEMLREKRVKDSKDEKEKTALTSQHPGAGA